MSEYPRAAAPNARSRRAHSLHLTSLHFTQCDSPHRAQVCAAHPAPDAARPRRRPSPHDPSRLRRPDVRWLISQYRLLRVMIRLLRVMIRVPFGLRCLYPSPHEPSKAYSLCRQCTLRRPFAFVALTVYCARGRTVAHAVCTLLVARTHARSHRTGRDVKGRDRTGRDGTGLALLGAAALSRRFASVSPREYSRTAGGGTGPVRYVDAQVPVRSARLLR